MAAAKREMTREEKAWDYDYLNGLLRKIINGKIEYNSPSKRSRILDHIRSVIVKGKLEYKPETAKHDVETHDEKLTFLSKNYNELKELWKIK